MTEKLKQLYAALVYIFLLNEFTRPNHRLFWKMVVLGIKVQYVFGLHQKF